MEDIQQAVSSAVQSGWLKALTLERLAGVLLLVLVGLLTIRMVLKLTDRLLDRAKSLTGVRIYIRTAVQAVLWLLLGLTVAESLNVDVTSIIAVLSVAGIAVSLALQSTLSNLAGGIVLLVTRPFQVGDYVEADGVDGTITAITLSYTAFTTPDNKEIFVPNSQLAAVKIINYNALGKRRLDLKFSASYDASTQRVRDAILEAVSALPQILDDPAPAVYLSEYQASSIQYLLRLWTRSEDYWEVYYALLEGVRESFARWEVEMTYDHLNVHIVEPRS